MCFQMLCHVSDTDYVQGYNVLPHGRTLADAVVGSSESTGGQRSCIFQVGGGVYFKFPVHRSKNFS